jgi:hypothetical protein
MDAKMEYSNKTVYDFLIEECKTKPALWAEFSTGLMEHTCDADFWESMSEELDCFRICEECGQPMIEGFVVDGCQTYCSEECLHKHISEEEYREAYNNGDGDTYWTTWYEDSNTYNRNN